MSDVPDAFFTFFLNHISQIISYNYKLIADEKKNFEGLRVDLETLQFLTRDFAKFSRDSDFLKDLVHRIRVKVHEAEDLIDKYVFLVVKKAKWKISPDVRQVVIDISECRKEFQKFKEEVKSGIQMLQCVASQPPEPRELRKARKVEEEHVIGFGMAIKDVSALLKEGPKHFKVILIVGMLGLGKSTLAKRVFKDLTSSVSNFNVRAFVYVGERNKFEVLLEILGSFTQINADVRRMSEDKLEQHVHDQLELEDTQFLIVLDDVRERKDWYALKDAFPNSKDKRCRVLITKCNNDLVEHGSMYELKFLPLEKSRELLRWRVFKHNSCPLDVLRYEEQIATKCDGLPMAIIAMAQTLLKNKVNRDYISIESWSTVVNNVNACIAGDVETEVAIRSRYEGLENKSCFLYLGVFPENFEIPVWKVVRMWIAEGLITEDGNLNLEDKAVQLLEELVHRNLVIAVQRRSNGRTKTFRVHVTILEFCKTKAQEVLLFQHVHNENLFTSALDQCRRLCVGNINDVGFNRPALSGKRVRSLLTFAKERITCVVPNFVSSIPKKFEILRVLDIQSLVCATNTFDFGSLILLKYVAISSSNIEVLPWKLAHMWFLQTLIIHTTSPKVEIKEDIWKLQNLRHLHINASTILPSPSNSKTPLVRTNIQTLCTIAPESCSSNVFDMTPKLRKLWVRGELTVFQNFQPFQIPKIAKKLC